MSKYPRLQAWEISTPELFGSGTHKAWAVWCKYCRLYHSHSPEAGHRIGHCNISSPYRDNGYVLVGGGKPPTTVAADIKRNKPHGPKSLGLPEELSEG